MITRRRRPYIEDRLKHMPAVILLGPRQVGKTTLARNIASRKAKSNALYLDLERPVDQRRLQDADTFQPRLSGDCGQRSRTRKARPSIRVVHGSTETWPESEGVTAIGLVELMRKLAGS